MTGIQKIATWLVIVLVLSGAVAAWFLLRSHPPAPAKPIAFSGVVLVQDTDPKKQGPVSDAIVRAARGEVASQTKSDPAGLFHLELPPPARNTPPLPTTLTFTHNAYQPLEITVDDPHKLFLAHLTPEAQLVKPAPGSKQEIAIENVRVRYSEKASFTSDSGSLVKTLPVDNVANVPCDMHLPCSPDGRWKAALRSFSIDAPGNEFRNIRVSCIAGPCPFSNVQSQRLVNGNRTLDISILNWSDTVTYLLEAEVTRTVVSDMVRESYPVIFGTSMSFTLPPSAEGLSIEAEEGGQGNIVFPLGPDLKLSWAYCSEQRMPNNAKFFRCDLKPGFQFKQ